MELYQQDNSIFWFDLEANDLKEFISIYVIIDEKISIIETGPASGHARLLDALSTLNISLDEVSYVIPTHIHLDHFGGGGHLMEVCKNAEAIVHPRALSHVIDPEMLWSGSQKVLGKIADLYGKPKPINSERVFSVSDGDEIDLGTTKLKAVFTPGHASHHITWVRGKTAFVGDSLGLWYKDLKRAFPVTPPRYDHNLALESIAIMKELDLEWLNYTHFGPRESVGALVQVEEEFNAWMDIVRRGFTNNSNPEEILDVLLKEREDLVESQRSDHPIQFNFGSEQAATHIVSVHGMLDWLRRSNDKS